jgi:hypothetical protein
MINADQLQALEYVLDEVRRLSEVARTSIEAQQTGETLSTQTLASYAGQLRSVEQQRDQMAR